MTYEEAIEWFENKRSMTNLIPQEPYETWEVRIAQADAAMIQQAYWIVRYNKEVVESHDWYCGCGHWNGSNLAVCAGCGREVNDSR
jgi:hypothetical protein